MTLPRVVAALEPRLSSEVGAAVLAGEASIGMCRAGAPAGLATITVSSVLLDHVVVRYERWVTETQVMDSVVAGFGLVALDHAFPSRLRPSRRS